MPAPSASVTSDRTALEGLGRVNMIRIAAEYRRERTSYDSREVPMDRPSLPKLGPASGVPLYRQLKDWLLGGIL